MNRARNVGVLLGSIFAITTFFELCSTSYENEDFIMALPDEEAEKDIGAGGRSSKGGIPR